MNLLLDNNHSFSDFDFLFLEGPFSEILSVSKSMFHGLAVEYNHDELPLGMFYKTRETRPCRISDSRLNPLVK
jgi:hypothetical protein